MYRVYKYPVKMTNYFEVEMPKDAEILKVDVQHGQPFMWALVDPENEEMERIRFRRAGTGNDIKEDDIIYRGTFFVDGGKFVYHLFEIYDD